MTRQSLFVTIAFGGGAALMQTPSRILMTPDVRRVAPKLASLCGACNNSVAAYAMLDCSYCRPRREQIASLLSRRMKDAAIIGMVVAEVGRRAFAAPPAEGFLLLGWTMPCIAATLGPGESGLP